MGTNWVRVRMRNRTTENIEGKARVWGLILESLWRRGCVEVDAVAEDIELCARDIRDVCREMAEMGWLELRGENRRWVAGESADELLRRYPALRSDVAGPSGESGGSDGRGLAAD